MTVEKLAALAEIDKGHLSRIETGHRNLSEDLAAVLAGHLGLPAESLLIASGRLPSTVISTLATEAVARALAPPQLLDETLPALRRLHLAKIAEEHLIAVFGSADQPQRAPRLVSAAGLTLGRAADAGIQRVAPGRYTIGPDIPEDHAPLVAGHLVAHEVLGNGACDFATFGDDELEATALGSFLLAPRPALRSLALRLRSERRVEPWGDVTAMITLVAERFALPVWVAARRLAEDGLLNEMVEVPDL